VSEVEDWTLSDLDYHIVDKEMKQRMLQMLELLLERQEEATARQEKMYAELKVAILASFRGSTTCQTETTTSSKELEVTNLEATPEETEAAVERQTSLKKR
jgi:protein-disulfide isomerase